MWSRRLIVHRRSVLAAGAVVLCTLLACRPGSSRDPAPTAATTGTPAAGAAQPADTGRLVCETYCSPIRPGTPVAEVRFVVEPQAGGASGLRKAAEAQNIEATVHEDGFERGLFVRLPTVAPQARFAPAGAAAGKSLPGLESLTVSALATSQEEAGALRLATPGEGGRENIVLQVQGLDSGMNYYWRVRAPGASEPQVVMCRAPICPADKRRP